MWRRRSEHFMEHKRRGLLPDGWTERLREKENLIAALLMTAALFVPIVLRYDLYYDLNDDVLIKDILSGVYTGTPEGHAVQLLYPLGLCLSLLYRALGIPVFGAFLALCQFGSIFLVGYETACCLDRCAGKPLAAGGKRFALGLRLEKLLALTAEGVFFAAAFGRHLVFLQYTVTAGMLAGAAIFRFLTAEEKGTGVRAFLRCHALTFALYWLAFCLRSEMALLLLPLAGVAGLCRWGREKAPFSRGNVRKYPGCFCVLLLGCLLLAGWDGLAYRSADWQSFRRFFDARTELYDYHADFINDYEANQAAYQAAGVTRLQQMLLENYDFGADDTIDADLLEALQAESARLDGTGGLFRKSLREGLWDLAYGHWLGAGDRSLNAVMLLMGGLAVLLCLAGRRWRALWQALLALAAGGALWLFLLMRDRPVDRVLHPLYLAQILLFAGLALWEAETAGRMAEEGPAQKEGNGTARMSGNDPVRMDGNDFARVDGNSLVRADGNGLARADGNGSACADGNSFVRADRNGPVRESENNPAGRRRVSCLIGLAGAVLVLALSLFRLPETAADVRQEYDRRETVNAACREVMDYCAAHTGRLFLEDVYSTVDFSEKIAVDREKPFNYDLLGGWLVKSPLTEKKLAAFGFSSMGEAVKNGPPVSLLTEAGSDLQWLETLFEQEGCPLRVLRTGEIAGSVDVYQVLPSETGEELLQQAGTGEELRQAEAGEE